MTDSPHDPARPPRQIEDQDDPQYHDEDLEIHYDESGQRPRFPGARKPLRRPMVRRRFDDED